MKPICFQVDNKRLRFVANLSVIQEQGLQEEVRQIGNVFIDKRHIGESKRAKVNEAVREFKGWRRSASERPWVRILE